MSRQKKDRALLLKMSERLRQALEGVDMTTAEIALALGYTNATTLTNAKRGMTFPDVERLAKLASLRTSSGAQIDLHWLITGSGNQLRLYEPRARSGALRQRVQVLVESLSEDQLRAMNTLLLFREKNGKARAKK